MADRKKGKVDAGQVPPERRTSPGASEGMPGYGQPDEGVRNPGMSGAEDLDDIGADGGGQKTSVGEPYVTREAHRGVEKEQHRDKKAKGRHEE